ncbi:CocE/NonD family hydrolase [Nocardioides nanhaiensis]|uniref:CocE/NonD family hydrolase n=1 Tax=Nocardioides nanhaiensis TaxID=1476871 RepID=A0ABP8VQM6_9ACTN
MHRRALTTVLATTLMALGLLLPAVPPGAAAPPAAPAAAAAPAAPAAPAFKGWKPRPATVKGTATTRDLPITVDDGTILRGDLVQPATAAGEPLARRAPVLVVVTAYNKSASSGIGLTGSGADYFVRRGYAVLTVDARGTGGSQGTWGAFSAREGRDAAAVVEWAHRQSWSNGRVGMMGPSYLGITQVFAAARRPAGLKAIFPQVPAADVYRDVVASGGQVDAGFIPLWLGLVTGTGLVPPAYAVFEPAAGFQTLLDRLTTATTFTLPLLAGAVLGSDPAFDGPFYRERSPINVVDRVRVPTFLVGGQHDIFQRGTPLLFERLQRQGVPTRMIIGPWDHLQGSSGEGLADAGYGTLEQLQLRWFDRYVMGREDPRLLRDIAPVSYYEQGSDRWVRTQRWIDRDLRPRTLRLSGGAVAGLRMGVLATGSTAAAGRAVVPPVPVSGLCTRSASQWTAGLLRQAWPSNPCLRDNRLNDATGVVYQTGPITKRLRIQGPINARLFTSTPTGDGMLSVALADVAPDGTVTRLTGGWQVISHRALDRERSRYLRGRLIQPHHPFTKAAKRPLARGQVAPVDVEVFPTGAVIKKGHRLRIAVQAFDVPHLLPTLPDLPSTLAPLTIHAGQRYPSVVTLPVRP